MPMLFAGAGLLQLHAAPEFARAQAQERDAVAVVRVHVRLHLEDEAGDFLFGRMNDAPLRRPARAAAARVRQRIEISSRTPKFFSAEPK